MEKAFEIIELANKTGKVRRGCNEVTKALEQGKAKFVVAAQDTSPKEIIMHLPLLAKEKGVPCVMVEKKEELGAASGIPLGTAAVAVIEAGDAKDLIKNFSE